MNNDNADDNIINENNISSNYKIKNSNKSDNNNINI